MKWVALALGLGLAALLVTAIFMRVVGSNPDRWHVDPATVGPVDPDNASLAERTFQAGREETAAALRDALGGSSIAGDLEQGHATFVVRTPVMGFPDYVSVRLEEAEQGTRAILYSRSRYGRKDLGANRRRVTRVLDAMARALSKS